jgi:hypothetical protein
LYIYNKELLMNIKLLILFIFFGLVSKLKSQVSTLYTFSETTGTYAAITSGTQLVTTTAGATAYDTDGNSITLPTSSQFIFNNITITSVYMMSDGFLWLNPGVTMANVSGANAVTGPISSTRSADGVISAMGMDLRSTALASQVYERRWHDDGTEVIFQWQNAARFVQSSVERFSFQIRINKTTDVIRVIYGNMTTIANSTTYQPMVGLRGSTNTDFNNRRLTTSVPDNSPNWGAPNGTTAGTSNAHQVRFTSNGSSFPTSGLIFVWTPPEPLPIVLMSFEGLAESGYNHLFWKTASESNNDYFTIERTQDGINYKQLTNINGAGNSNTTLSYDYIDYDIENTINYYRLKQTDYDGKFEYSHVIAIDNTRKVRLVVRVVNLLGNDVDITTKGLLILVYDDGSIKKIFNE